ncbi:hypothetical protein MZM54_05055 [[Brevibacterium] frigoritolerans]|nr:hypothetical protein [Peribacillus frigoritolerans]
MKNVLFALSINKDGYEKYLQDIDSNIFTDELGEAYFVESPVLLPAASNNQFVIMVKENEDGWLRIISRDV